MDWVGGEAGGEGTIVLPRATRPPVSTYRVQFNSGFTFKDAASLIPYLHHLGVTDLYSSPYLKARPGSPHGYDVCDHRELNPELGSERDYQALVAGLKKYGMGQIMDVVPNHMSIWETSNARWMDVLENGPASTHARFFDIDWHPIRGDTQLENRVLLPILGSSYGEALESQELALAYEEGAFFVRYYEHRLPVEPRSYLLVLLWVAERLEDGLPVDDERVHELRSILTALVHLPACVEREPEEVLERQREIGVVKRRLRELFDRWKELRETVEETVRLFNGARGDPASFDPLDSLLDLQPYRLANWRVAAEEINYRRFFDVNDLAAIRPEDPPVFEEIHQMVFCLLREGAVTGLRIDHPDGLLDPAAYFAAIQESYRAIVSDLTPLPPLPMREGGIDSPFPCGEEGGGVRSIPLYVVAEKILCGGESLNHNWPVHGTTGYDFAAAVNGIFVDCAAERALGATYRAFAGMREEFGELTNSCKKAIMRVALASEINMLAYHLKRIAGRNRHYRDFTLNGLTSALREVIACLPVYRTYISCDRAVDDRDRACVEATLEEAKRRNPKSPASLFDFVGDLLLLRWPEGVAEEDRAEATRFVCRFQQTTGPVMAKAVEDTTFYLYNRLISLNEVGGNPAQFGNSVRSFHRQNLERLRWWPYSMTCTSTHDTKRSEDVRARIDALSEMPREWKAAVNRWAKLNRRRKRDVGGRAVPDRNEEYYLYQTLLGAWPLGTPSAAEYETFVDRMQTHMEKALREAKANTSWIIPNAPYEEAVRAFVQDVLEDAEANPFLESFRAFQRKVAHFGLFNSLSQTLLKIASPGVPDFYQGSEIWDFSLVDPDNRRPIDFALREAMLAELRRRLSSRRALANLARELVEAREDGRIKMYVIHRALSYRREHPDLFEEGAYVPLWAAGSQREHLCAFARRTGTRSALVVVPRLVVGLTRGKEIPPLGAEAWEDTCLRLPREESGAAFRNLFTGEIVQPIPIEGKRSGVPLASVFATFPVALLERL